ncbi:CofH family radical SAM protein [Desulfolutivibrio sulfoxidireducens]|uniref:CofH family radical SAM protein n=1 Tax=Desulfolutivibrio sulfoxidireducens TaxID=2773299 RepID=UPI00159D39A4|nr:CofH family radical SAM protein [Desulfolutivibrio sulfoxidireducens]QLA14936.1 CofH family radical SAM protein [Desulfolutivibrio sulfoxidireducens]QLA18503.1 CofH family radical SAM protein [Desulfolutivibrio sulfoxidireducens]
MHDTSPAARRILDRPSSVRLTPDDALTLVREASPHDLCARAMDERLRRHGHAAYYVFNQHINFTNECVNACRFCAFSKRPGSPDAVTHTVDDIRAMIRRRLGQPVREMHIVGGLNPKLPFSYYLELVRAVARERPEAAIKAFTAVEVAHLADVEGRTEEDILAALMEAGLMMLPGGGAEVFSPALRAKLCPEKISGERWLRVHAKAHGLGLPTNATMLFGHIEAWEDRIEHLHALRALQDKTGGFLCFIPLPYQPGNNPLSARGPDGADYLRTIAISRLYLDNIPNLKAYWVMAGIKAAQMALWAGADDFDGTLVEERVGHAAGADTPKGLTVTELRQAIAMAGFTPVERDARFRPVEGG